MTDQDIVEKFISVYKSVVEMKRNLQRDDDGEGWRLYNVLNYIYLFNYQLPKRTVDLSITLLSPLLKVRDICTWLS